MESLPNSGHPVDSVIMYMEGALEVFSYYKFISVEKGVAYTLIFGTKR